MSDTSKGSPGNATACAICGTYLIACSCDAAEKLVAGAMTDTTPPVISARAEELVQAYGAAVVRGRRRPIRTDDPDVGVKIQQATAATTPEYNALAEYVAELEARNVP